jgi:pimeloyl-ACP methyl ester carboxylesterase
LRKSGMHPVTFSFPGHGRRPFTSSFGIETFAGKLTTFIGKQKLDRPHVFGYSMGGFVALRLSVKMPASLGKIATLATKFLWTRETAEREARLLDPGGVREKVPAFANMLEEKHGLAWVELLGRTAEMMHALAADNLLDDANLASIKNRVLVGIGDRDQMVTFEETHHVCKTIPGAEMYMLPGTKHALESADPQLLAKVIVNFLERE